MAHIVSPMSAIGSPVPIDRLGQLRGAPAPLSLPVPAPAVLAQSLVRQPRADVADALADRFGLAPYRTDLQSLLAKASRHQAAGACWSACFETYLGAAAFVEHRPSRLKPAVWPYQVNARDLLFALGDLLDAADTADAAHYGDMVNQLPWPEFDAYERARAHQLLGFVPTFLRRSVLSRLQATYAQGIRPMVEGLGEGCSFVEEPLLNVQLALHDAIALALADRTLERPVEAGSPPPFVVQELSYLLPTKSSRLIFAKHFRQDPDYFNVPLLRSLNAHVARLPVSGPCRIDLVNSILRHTDFPRPVLADLAERCGLLHGADVTASSSMVGEFLVSLVHLLKAENVTLFSGLWNHVMHKPRDSCRLDEDITIERRALVVAGSLYLCTEKQQADLVLAFVEAAGGRGNLRRMLVGLEQVSGLARRDLSLLAAEHNLHPLAGGNLAEPGATVHPGLLGRFQQRNQQFAKKLWSLPPRAIGPLLRNMHQELTTHVRLAACTSNKKHTWRQLLLARPAALTNLAQLCAETEDTKPSSTEQQQPSPTDPTTSNCECLHRAFATAWRRCKHLPRHGPEATEQELIAMRSLVTQLDALGVALLSQANGGIDIEQNLALAWHYAGAQRQKSLPSAGY